MTEIRSIEENLNLIKKNISDASTSPEVIELVAVTKLQPYEKVKAVIQLGITSLGVNYVQEGKVLMSQVAKDFPGKKIDFHFIGHIQSKKVKDLVQYSSVDSLDRIEVAEELNRRLQALQKKIRVLVEVNIGEEPQKSGVFPKDLFRFLEQCKGLTQLKIEGMMAMPPAVEPEKRREYFKTMKSLYDKAAKSFEFRILSLGTSDDYSIAIQEGAQQIRLGTSLFGARPRR